MSSGVPKHCGPHSMSCSGVPLAAMPASPRVLPEDGEGDAGVTPGQLLAGDGQQQPARVEERLGDEVEGVEPDPGGLLDDGPRGLLPLVPLVGGRPDHVFGEVVDPLLDLQLVLVEVEGEIGHGARSVPARAGPANPRRCRCVRPGAVEPGRAGRPGNRLSLLLYSNLIGARAWHSRNPAARPAPGQVRRDVGPGAGPSRARRWTGGPPTAVPGAGRRRTPSHPAGGATGEGRLSQPGVKEWVRPAGETYVDRLEPFGPSLSSNSTA